MPTYKEQQILDKVCKVTRQKQIKYYDFIPFFDFQYEKIIFNCQPSHFSPCSAVPVKALFLILFLKKKKHLDIQGFERACDVFTVSAR